MKLDKDIATALFVVFLMLSAKLIKKCGTPSCLV